MRYLLLLALVFASACSDGWTIPPAEPETTTVQVVAEHPDGGFIGGTVINGETVLKEDSILGIVAGGTRFRALYLSSYPDSAGGRTVQATRSRTGTRTEQRSGYCWYLITYNLETGEIVSEELLWCDTGTNPCDTEQEAIAGEYDTYDVGPRQKPTCDLIELNGSGTYHFSWSELNGGWAGGNESRHQGYGWVQSALKTGLENMRFYFGEPMVLSSGYRCPAGNASVRGVSRSYHIVGRAADISVWWLTGFSGHPSTWTPSQDVKAQMIYARLNTASIRANAREQQVYTKYADRHFHAAWTQ